MTGIRRAAYYAAAPLICLLVFWRVPFTWFLNDDFAWLGLPLEVNRASDLLHVIFEPKAQGTIRFLSDRLFFLTFSSLFGFHALPYRVLVFSTWFLALGLAAAIGTKLTGSRAAGLIAAILWTTNPNIVTPMAWASAYDQVLCAFFLLAAFYSRLRWIETGRRGWIAAEWAAYLLGFGALETIVMYPAVAALYSLCLARKKFWSTIPLFIPAGIFAILHFLFIPKSAGPYYSLIIDRRLPETFLRYLAWTLGPIRLGEWIGHWHRAGLIATILIGAGLLGFALLRLRQRDHTVLFCMGWFVLLLAPVLPLPNHIIDYYVTMAVLGLAWLGGWAMVAAWNAGGGGKAVAVALAAAYFGGSLLEIDAYTRWYYDRSLRMRALVLGVEQTARAHPGASILLQGVDNELFQSGFQDDPFRLFGLQRLYFVPGGDQGIVARADLGGTTRFLITPSQALDRIEHGQGYVLSVSNDGIQDVTRTYETVLRADPRATRHDFIDVGDPNYAAELGPGWFAPEQGFRWMSRHASLKLSAPASAGQRLYVTGFAPGAVIGGGPVTLRFSSGGVDLGSATLRKADEQFAIDFALPAAFVGQNTMEITIDADRALHPPGDNRELSMVFGTFSIR